MNNDGPVPPDGETFSPRLGNPEPGERFRLAAVGDGVDGGAESKAVAALIESWEPDTFAYLGDVYDNGTYQEFDQWYAEPDGYSQFIPITNPTVGNHEYRVPNPGAEPYFEFWDEVPHYYSYDVGGWHVVVVDSNTEFGQLGRNSEQFRWLAEDLAANQSQCTLFYAHHARYTAVRGVGRTGMQPMWELLWDQGADIILGGHAHTYERWQPMDKQNPAQPQLEGITQFVVGTGGRPILNDKVPEPRLVTEVTKPGALLLELGPTDANFTFQTADGSYTDSGTVTCRTRPEVEPTVESTLTGNEGWERGDVSLIWDISDPESPVTGVGCDDVFITADQPATTYTCTATSGGGITARSETIKRDGTPPVVTCDSAPTYLLNQPDTTVGADVTDALSGAVNNRETSPVATTRVGDQTGAVTGTDVAGSTATADCGYRVLYDFVGFSPPIDNEPSVNMVRAGQVVPFKWRLLDFARTPVTALDAARISTTVHDCTGGAPGEPVTETPVGGSGLQNLGDGFYQLNWRAPSGYAGSCRTLRLDLGEGVLHSAEFQFTA